jgi:hypothetical protein
MPSPRSMTRKWVGSLKTEEKTKFVEPACQEDKPTIDLPFRLTHQCTNWEWFEPGRTNAYQRLNCSP